MDRVTGSRIHNATMAHTCSHKNVEFVELRICVRSFSSPLLLDHALLISFILLLIKYTLYYQFPRSGPRQRRRLRRLVCRRVVGGARAVPLLGFSGHCGFWKLPCAAGEDGWQSLEVFVKLVGCWKCGRGICVVWTTKIILTKRICNQITCLSLTMISYLYTLSGAKKKKEKKGTAKGRARHLHLHTPRRNDLP